MNYGLGLGNLTNLDKSKKGEISQQGAFTIVKLNGADAADYQSLDDAGCENLAIKGFTFIGLRGWRYSLVKKLAELLVAINMWRYRRRLKKILLTGVSEPREVRNPRVRSEPREQRNPDNPSEPQAGRNPSEVSEPLSTRNPQKMSEP